MQSEEELKPIEIVSPAENSLWDERCRQLKEHNSYVVRQLYFPYNMDKWYAKEKEICRDFNLRIQRLNKIRKDHWEMRIKKRFLELVETYNDKNVLDDDLSTSVSVVSMDYILEDSDVEAIESSSTLDTDIPVEQTTLMSNLTKTINKFFE